MHPARLFAILLISVMASQAAPSQPAPRWWKGNLHTHTLWSDGDDYPEMVVDWYAAVKPREAVNLSRRNARPCYFSSNSVMRTNQALPSLHSPAMLIVSPLLKW